MPATLRRWTAHRPQNPTPCPGLNAGLLCDQAVCPHIRMLADSVLQSNACRHECSCRGVSCKPAGASSPEAALTAVRRSTCAAECKLLGFLGCAFGMPCFRTLKQLPMHAPWPGPATGHPVHIADGLLHLFTLANACNHMCQILKDCQPVSLPAQIQQACEGGRASMTMRCSLM